MRSVTLKPIYILIFCVIFIVATVAISSLTSAVELFPEEICNSQTQAQSGVCEDASKEGNPIFGPQGILTSAINLLSIVVGIAAVFVIIYGGLKFITSSTNPQEVSKAREIIIYAVIGLLVAISAQALVRLLLTNL